MAASTYHEWDFGSLFLLDSVMLPCPSASDIFLLFNAVSLQETSSVKSVDKQEQIQGKKMQREFTSGQRS